MRVIRCALVTLLLATGCFCGDREDEPPSPDELAAERAEDERRRRLETEQIVRRLEAIDEDEERVIELLDELSWVGHPDAVRTLSTRMVDEREEVAIQAAISLSEVGGPESVRALGRAFGKPGRAEVKLKAIESLNYVAYEDTQAATEILIGALYDEHPEVRADAAEALVLIEEPAVLASIREAYADASHPDRVRRELAGVLEELGELAEEEAP